MAYTFTRNQSVSRHTKRFVTSSRTFLLKAGPGNTGIEDNATNIIGGKLDDPTAFAPHDYHPVDLARQ